MTSKQEALAAIDREQDRLTALSDAIWDHPEIRYQEFFAVKTLCDFLREEGFSILEGVADIPTAFCASYGGGSPVIGLLAEYDALERMSQAAELTSRCPVQTGAAGHGCGHNLLGVGVVGAALAIRDYLKGGHTGTVQLFGCPAEEGGSGKTFMARDGVFNGIDIALTWHPGDTNNVANGSNLANCQVAYHFHGKASHAALSPELGRSALDAVELLNVGVQFLREHIPQNCRIQYAITNAGGNSPNVVQARADVLYLMRAPQLDQVHSLNQRVDDIARGAALMTGTTLEIEFIKACSNVLPNKVLGLLMQKNFEALGSAQYDQADRELAAQMQASMGEKDDYYRCLVDDIQDEALCARLMADVDAPLYEQILPYPNHESSAMASSDVGDVSWVCPVVQLSAVTMPGGTIMHSWQEVAVGKSALAHKGMLQAARVIASTTIDAINNPEIIRLAKEEKDRRTGGKPYSCPIPEGIRPPMQ
ncbi:MAG: amidohydrolase [Lawsonibacter sp.]|nr:amidohydrolase [Lawsonibacter sp.]